MQSDSESDDPMNTAPSSARSLPGEKEELAKVIEPTFMVIELKDADQEKEVEKALKDIKLERSTTTDLKKFVAQKYDVKIVNNKKVRSLQCQICGDSIKIFSQQHAFSHVDTHFPFPRYKCPVDGCGMKLYSQNVSHVRRQHRDVESATLAEANLDDEQKSVWDNCLRASFRELEQKNGKWKLRNARLANKINYESVEQERVDPDEESIADEQQPEFESVVDNVVENKTKKKEKIKCKQCGESVTKYSDASKYMPHVLGHLDFYEYKCSACPKTYKTNKNSHKSEDIPDPKQHKLTLVEFEPEEQTLYETIGEKCFDEIEFNHDTGKYVMKGQKVKCMECGFFIYKSDISYHLYSHSEYYRYQCTHDGCTYKFKSKNNLRHHLTDSHGIKDFSNTKCKIRSRNEDELEDLMKKCFPPPQPVQAQEE